MFEVKLLSHYLPGLSLLEEKHDAVGKKCSSSLKRYWKIQDEIVALRIGPAKFDNDN
jgi:hypothetical protein